MSEYFAQLTQAQNKIEEARKQVAEQAQSVLKPALSQFLVDNPTIHRVEWSQYTPHFNDGDTCEFSVHEPYFFLNEDDEGTELYGSWKTAMGSSYRCDFAEAIGETTYNNCTAFSDELSALSDALHAVFGDHVKVIVTRDGVEVDEYDHD